MKKNKELFMIVTIGIAVAVIFILLYEGIKESQFEIFSLGYLVGMVTTILVYFVTKSKKVRKKVKKRKKVDR